MSDDNWGVPLACVMGSMDLVRPLGLAGIRCATVAGPGSPELHSRFTVVAVPCEAGISASAVRLLAALMEFAASCSAPPVLFYEQDWQLLFVSRHRQQLARAFRFVVPEAELVEDLVDKRRFLALAERLRLPVPPTRRISRDGPGPEELGLRLPLIVKPPTRDEAWNTQFGPAKALEVETLDALRALWPRFGAVGQELLAQEKVPGPETRIESYHVYVDSEGRIAAEFTGRKIRTYPPTYGYSTALVTTDAPDVAALGRSSVEALGLRGVAKFDFKRGPDGRLHLLEVNPRFNLWHHLGAVAGVNIPAMVHADMIGASRPAAGPARAGVRWCTLSRDWRAARASGMSPWSWAAWALGCEAKSVVAWDDPMPYLSSRLSRGIGGALRPPRWKGARKA